MRGSNIFGRGFLKIVNFVLKVTYFTTDLLNLLPQTYKESCKKLDTFYKISIYYK